MYHVNSLQPAYKVGIVMELYTRKLTGFMSEMGVCLLRGMDRNFIYINQDILSEIG